MRLTERVAPDMKNNWASVPNGNNETENKCRGGGRLCVRFAPQPVLLTGASHVGTITKESEWSFAHFTTNEKGAVVRCGREWSSGY